MFDTTFARPFDDAVSVLSNSLEDPNSDTTTVGAYKDLPNQTIMENDISFCGDLSVDEEVRTTVNDPRRAVTLPEGSVGTAQCYSSFFKMVFVCFPSWSGGHSRVLFCSSPPPASVRHACPPHSGWWLSCGDIEPTTPPLSLTPTATPPPAPPTTLGSSQHWALLIAGSKSYANYRHQADVYHAYQLLHKHGISPERMVVMHFDDIAYNRENPHQGVVINNPKSENVYQGVPKDYVGNDVNAETFLAVLAGDSEAVAGKGSGKVIASGPNDKVFVYYADHGSPGLLGMPSGGFLFAHDLITTLKDKFKSGGFKEMVMYIEACESGSMFDGLLPSDLNIFVTTAANDFESSWGYYCPSNKDPPPIEYTTCLGDKYSISWLEDTDTIDQHPLETLQEQYGRVKSRTGGGGFQPGSHVMEFGTLNISGEKVLNWIGDKHDETEGSNEASLVKNTEGSEFKGTPLEQGELCGQHKSTLLHYATKIERAIDEKTRSEAQKVLDDIMQEQRHIDELIESLTQQFQIVTGPIMTSQKGKALVEDWHCFKNMIQSWEASCGPLGEFGMKHSRVFAHLCNKGIKPSAIVETSTAICSQYIE
eukprot:CAMPEP_0196595490 /NCGR_PEP_ID=MMETSP1081-20130531/81263_1 /TAXON_ID=36882 /ORGANISM="Pyramimonas amylifera, Strain CCMP720" /LENGTH=591 /DNA_ID=CAMNT_0041920085 /DNA_START=129 /DNA_END=1904 /DNA_ORIENTATION=+